MKHTASSYVKLSLASLLVLASCCLCAWRLMKIQVVESERYSIQHVTTQKYTQTIQATRGDIVDSEGTPIIENKVGYDVIIEPDTFRRTTPRAIRFCSPLPTFCKSIRYSGVLPCPSRRRSRIRSQATMMPWLN
ncbi:MAG: hypothetical protein ACLT2C_06965 [Ruminococcus sp.]